MREGESVGIKKSPTSVQGNIIVIVLKISRFLRAVWKLIIMYFDVRSEII